MPQGYCVGVELGATINRASRKGSSPQDHDLPSQPIGCSRRHHFKE